MDSSQRDDAEAPNANSSPSDTFLDELEPNSDATQDPDALLAAALPNLEKEMKQIQSDFIGLNAEIESINLDDFEDKKIPLKSPKDRWISLRKKLKAIFFGITVKVFYRIKYLFIWIILEIPKKIGYLSKKIVSVLQVLAQAFAKWSLKRKILFVVFVISVSLIVLLYYKLIKSRILYKENFHFYGSMEELADYTFAFDINDKQEPFYNSPRVKVYSLQMKPLVVNLKRKNNSIDNPMGFFEFIFEGNSGDVVVELKERESEFLDIVSRVIETKSYESLETIDGKSAMKESIRKELNKKLNSGVIRKVEISNFFLKP